MQIHSGSVYTREIIPHEDLIYANTSVDMAYEFGNVIGMGLAGILIAVFGADLALGVIGIFFGLAALCFLGTKPGKFIQPPEISQGFIKNFMVAMSYLKNHKDLLIMAGVQAMILMIIMITPVLIAPFSREVLHASSIEFGSIEVSLSVGMVLTALFLPFLVGKFGFKSLLMSQLGLLFLVFLLFSFNKNIEVAAFLYFLMGLSFSCWPLLITEIQNQTPQQYQGRIQSTLNSLTALGVLCVYLFLESMGHLMSLSKIYWFESGFVLICMILLFFYKKSRVNSDN
jgi:predicted MFS family arabinose efflux permease